MDGNFKQIGLRPDSHSGERMDCTVTALSVATGLPYEIVHTLLAKAGRKQGQPFGMTDAWPNGKFANYRVTQVAREEYTLGRFTRTLGKSGRFIVRVKFRGKFVGHVYAVVNGVAHDNTLPERGDYQRLCQIWKLEAM